MDVYRVKSHSQDTKLGTHSIINYETESVDVDDVLLKAENPNEAMI